MLAQLTHAQTAVTAGGGSSFFYSAVADAVTAIPVSAADAVTDAAAMTTIAAAQSSGS